MADADEGRADLYRGGPVFVMGVVVLLLFVAIEAQAQEPSTRLPFAPSSLDPSERTVETVLREIQQLEQRMLDKIDALALKQGDFEERIEGFPTETQQSIAKLDELILERINTINTKFNVVDQRFLNVDSLFKALNDAIKVADANRAENIDIALTAQKQSGDKAAEGTAEQIKNINDVQRAREESLFNSIEGLRLTINDLKDRLTSIEQRSVGTAEQRSTAQDNQALWAGIIFGLVGAAVGIGSLVFAVTRSKDNIVAVPPAAPSVVYVNPPPPNGPAKA